VLLTDEIRVSETKKYEDFSEKSRTVVIPRRRAVVRTNLVIRKARTRRPSRNRNFGATTNTCVLVGKFGVRASERLRTFTRVLYT